MYQKAQNSFFMHKGVWIDQSNPDGNESLFVGIALTQRPNTFFLSPFFYFSFFIKKKKRPFYIPLRIAISLHISPAPISIIASGQ